MLLLGVRGPALALLPRHCDYFREVAQATTPWSALALTCRRERVIRMACSVRGDLFGVTL
jgi:hypothetical protein